ncbi:MAG: 6-phosphofructokinase [Bdellovibrionota bacterium]|jgi:6-phosphofructokinase
MQESVVILCAGGPAPGMNAVISAVAKTFLARGYRVLGLHGGYQALFNDMGTDHVLNIDIKMADRIHSRGGSALRMSRYKPKDDEFNTTFFVRHNIKLLVTVGGDDTASTATRIAKYLKEHDVQVTNIHVPKTIDNDLPLPEGIPTFGFKTATEEGTRIALTINEDARTTGNWFVMAAMGREAGHLAFAIGEACNAAMIIVPEMFNKVECTLERITRLMVSTIIKRQLLGLDYGIIIVSEGVFHSIPESELKDSGIQFTYDDHGHPELGILSKGQIFNTLLQRRLKELGVKIKSRPNDIGYELRCVRPIASDLQYCTALGAGVYKLFSEGHTGCMVTVDKDDKIVPLHLKDIQNPETGKVRTRLLNIENDVVKQTINNILHFLTTSDVEAARKIIPNPEDYLFRSILDWQKK